VVDQRHGIHAGIAKSVVAGRRSARGR